MIREKDQEPKLQEGTYLINRNNLRLALMGANQRCINKRQFIDETTERIRNYLKELLEDK